MFDIEGTLVDSTGFDGALYAQAVREVLDVDVDETWASYRNITDGGILDEILERGRFGAADELRARVQRRFVASVRSYLAGHASDVREIRGARALIESLLAIPDVCVAIATGGWLETAAMKLRHIGLDPDALPLATSSDAHERTSIMKLAAERALHGGVAAKRTYFGDGEWDRRASADLGFDFVAVGRTVEHPARFDDLADREAILRCLVV